MEDGKKRMGTRKRIATYRKKVKKCEGSLDFESNVSKLSLSVISRAKLKDLCKVSATSEMSLSWELGQRPNPASQQCQMS